SSAAASSAGSGAGSGGSSHGSTSGGGSSGVPGNPVPLDQLCPVIAKGYLRYQAFFLASLGGGSYSCKPAISDDEYLLSLYGDVDQAIRDACSPDGGLMFATVADISRANTNGRVRYDATK